METGNYVTEKEYLDDCSPSPTATVDPHNILWGNKIYFGVTMKKGQHLRHDKSYIDAYEAHLASLPNKEVSGAPLDRKGMVYTTVVEGVDYEVVGDNVKAIFIPL